MNSLKQTETFKPDCAKWLGYKPCVVQKRTGQLDCANCLEHEPTLPVLEVARSTYNPEVLKTGRAVGIVEMGGLGSILRTTAVTDAVRKQNTGADIVWFTHRRGADLLRYVPGVAAINVEDVPFDEYKEMIPELDAVLNFDHGPAAKSIVAESDCVGGFALNAQNNFYGVPPYGDYMQRLQIDDAFRSQNQLTMQQVLLKTAGLDEAEPKYDVRLEETNHRHADEVLREVFADRVPSELIGLNIGASEKGELKRWPAEYHTELATKLAEAYPDAGVVILSGPEDKTQLLSVRSQLRSDLPNLHVLPGDMEVGDFMALVARLKLLVTSDTFAFHAAKSQDVKSIVMTGPMPHQELEVAPGDIIIGPKLPCAPCYNRCIQPVLGQCMYDISVKEVLNKVTTALGD